MILSLTMLLVYPTIFLMFTLKFYEDKTTKNINVTNKFNYFYLLYLLIWSAFAKETAVYFIPSIAISALAVNVVTYGCYLKFFKIKMSNLELVYIGMSAISISALTFVAYSHSAIKSMDNIVVVLFFLMFYYLLKPYRKLEINPMKTLETFTALNAIIIILILIFNKLMY